MKMWAERFWHDFALNSDLRTELEAFVVQMSHCRQWDLEMCGVAIQSIIAQQVYYSLKLL
jgi:hypothetical protein